MPTDTGLVSTIALATLSIISAASIFQVSTGFTGDTRLKSHPARVEEKQSAWARAVNLVSDNEFCYPEWLVQAAIFGEPQEINFLNGNLALMVIEPFPGISLWHWEFCCGIDCTEIWWVECRGRSAN
jgi:hypothetical protein